MDQGLTYQKARRIRGTKMTDLLADQLLYEPSIGKAIKKTISLKTQSKIKGIKEKFDPLNIAKFLTGGSKLAPALLGKLMGRDIRDIEYFTGRNRPLRVGKGTASRITPTPGQGGDIEGINEELLKIYSFLKKSNDDETRRKEKEQNFAEEKEIESKKRHNELVDALKKLTGQKTTATKVKGGTDAATGSIFDDLKDLFDVFGGKKLMLNALRTLGSFLASPVGFILAGGALLSYIAANIAENEDFQKAFSPKNDPYGMLGALSGGAGEAASTLAVATKSKQEKKLVDDANALKNTLLKDAGFFARTYGGRSYLIEKKGLTEEEANFLMPGNQNGPEAEEKYGKIEDRIKYFEKIKQKVSGVKAEPVEKTAAAAPGTETSTESTGTTATTAAATGTASAVGSSTQTAEPVSSPKSGQLNTVMAENAQANLPTPAPTPTTETSQNLKTQSKGSATKTRLSEIAVRNIEPTFMQMIVSSTRVV